MKTTSILHAICAAVHRMSATGMDNEPDIVVLHPEDMMRLLNEVDAMHHVRRKTEDWRKISVFGCEVIASSAIKQGEMAVSKREPIKIWALP